MHPFFYSVLVSFRKEKKKKNVKVHYMYCEYKNVILVFFSFPPQLFDVVYREETLLNVIRSVTRNGRSIILTAVLALILVYMFSIIGFMFFKDDFLVSVDEEIIRKFLYV